MFFKEKMTSEDITFANGSIHLSGTLYKPKTQAKHPAVIVLHSATDGIRQSPIYRHLVANLPEWGFSVLLFDRRGSGLSSGDFETASFHNLAEDGSAAVKYLLTRDDIDSKQIGLYGISQGGWIAPLVVNLEPEISFLVIVSGCGVSPAKQMDYGAAYNLRLHGFPEGSISQAIAIRNRVNDYYRGRISKQIISRELDKANDAPWFQHAYINPSEYLPKDVAKSKWRNELDYDPIPVWKYIKQSVLFLYAQEDQWIPIQESMTKYRLATAHLKDVTMIQVKGTDHLMYKAGSHKTKIISKEYINTMITWILERKG